AVRGLVVSPLVATASMSTQEFWVGTRTAKSYERIDLASAKLLQMHSANFQVHWNDIAKIEYRARKRGMGNVPHSGRLVLQLRDGRTRELILLGRQNGNTLKEKFGHLTQASAGKLLAESRGSLTRPVSRAACGGRRETRGPTGTVTGAPEEIRTPDLCL